MPAPTATVGATHFAHQRLDAQPRKDATLLWPTEWTHAHRAEVLYSGRKYTITGWMHFPSPRGRA